MSIDRFTPQRNDIQSIILQFEKQMDKSQFRA